jgi:hypothetical protein
VISGAAFVPHPPLLVPELAGGAAAELDAVRRACGDAIVAVVARGARPVLLGGGPVSLSHSPLSRGSFAVYGVGAEIHLGSPGCGGSVDLPLSLTVGAWLLREALGPRNGAVGFSVGPGFAASRAAVELLALAESSDVALVVLADGSARRSRTAPGYLDDRAAEFDASVAGALRRGDPDALQALDAGLGEELLAAGVPAWHAAGSLLADGHYDAHLSYEDAPYGVGYFVATWHARG